MSKKHFEAMAAEVRETFESANSTNEVKLSQDLRQRALGAMYAFIRIAQKFNPRFDASRFEAACGYDSTFGEYKS